METMTIPSIGVYTTGRDNNEDKDDRDEVVSEDYAFEPRYLLSSRRRMDGGSS